MAASEPPVDIPNAKRKGALSQRGLCGTAALGGGLSGDIAISLPLP